MYRRTSEQLLPWKLFKNGYKGLSSQLSGPFYQSGFACIIFEYFSISVCSSAVHMADMEIEDCAIALIDLQRRLRMADTDNAGSGFGIWFRLYTHASNSDSGG